MEKSSDFIISPPVRDAYRSAGEIVPVKSKPKPRFKFGYKTRSLARVVGGLCLFFVAIVSLVGFMWLFLNKPIIAGLLIILIVVLLFVRSAWQDAHDVTQDDDDEE